MSQIVLTSSIKSISGNIFLRLVFPKACIPSRIRLKFEFESAYNRLLTNLNSTFAKSMNLTLNLVFFKLMNFEFISNFSSYSLNYAEACEELAGPICASFSPSNSASFEEMLHLKLLCCSAPLCARIPDHKHWHKNKMVSKDLPHVSWADSIVSAVKFSREKRKNRSRAKKKKKKFIESRGSGLGIGTLSG